MILAAVAALVGAAVQSATGFGFALVLSPALFAVLDPAEAVTTALALGLFHNLLVTIEHGRPRHVDWRRLAPVLVAAVPGMAVGVLLLTLLSKDALQVGVGVAVIAAAVWQLRRRSSGAVRAVGRITGWVAGFVSGALTTSISVSGPPIVLWLEAHGVRPVEFRASLAASFLSINLAGIVLLLAAEGSGALDAGVVLPLLGFVLVGYGLGTFAFRRFPAERFSTAVLTLVVATGAASVLAGVGVL